MQTEEPRPKYTLETLQLSYSLSIPQAVNILDKFGSERSGIDRFMRHCSRRRKAEKRGIKSGN